MPPPRKYWRTFCCLLALGLLAAPSHPNETSLPSVANPKQPNLTSLPRLPQERILRNQFLVAQAGGGDSVPQQEPQSTTDILQYIAGAWDQLTRSLTRCETYADPKVTGEPVLYLPVEVPSPPELSELQKQCKVRVERLPARITAPGQLDPSKLRAQGLLYLEHPYVVPGGQFNEMYGWDSYFIIRGLLRDGREALARGMVENFFFELEHYGSILNANRTYYLTRSQPPFLSSMILAVYEARANAGQEDLAWLERAYGYAVKDYDQWTSEPHLAGDTGLSRYFDRGEGPVPEIEGDPDDYYREVARYFAVHGNGSYLVEAGNEHNAHPFIGPVFSLFVCDTKASQPNPKAGECDGPDPVGLSADFYKGDRSMRESGFDESFRFGALGAETHHYAPMCLNSLLYKTEKDLQRISAKLGRDADARRWSDRAVLRAKRMRRYLWSERRGFFFDYNFVNRRQSSYAYATAFYPLWAGVASAGQARAVVRHLGWFEQPGGLAMSRKQTGEQWDYPFGWAPIHLLAVEGLRSYGYQADADRVAYKFLNTVEQNFLTDHTIREKYDVVTKSAATHVVAGYRQNVIGFGWTNAAFLELLRGLPAELATKLAPQAKQ